MKFLIFLTVLISIKAYAFSPNEYFVDLASKDEDLMVLMDQTKTNATNYDKYQSTEKANAGLTLYGQDGSKFEYVRELVEVKINGKKICTILPDEKYFEMADKGIKIELGGTKRLPCKRRPSEGFPILYQKTKMGSHSEGFYEVANVYNYFLTMPISEIKDQKIYSLYKGKNFGSISIRQFIFVT